MIRPLAFPLRLAHPDINPALAFDTAASASVKTCCDILAKSLRSTLVQFETGKQLAQCEIKPGVCVHRLVHASKLLVIADLMSCQIGLVWFGFWTGAAITGHFKSGKAPGKGCYAETFFTKRRYKSQMDLCIPFAT